MPQDSPQQYARSAADSLIKLALWIAQNPPDDTPVDEVRASVESLKDLAVDLRDWTPEDPIGTSDDEGTREDFGAAIDSMLGGARVSEFMEVD